MTARRRRSTRCWNITAGGVDNPGLAGDIKPLKLTDAELKAMGDCLIALIGPVQASTGSSLYVNPIKYQSIFTGSVMKTSLLVVTMFLFAGVASAENFIVDQKNKEFSRESLIIEVGDTVEFLNSDPFYHNIYSLSEVRPFDLGSYPQGESRGITFQKAGTVEVRCAIHPQMKMTIKVKQAKQTEQTEQTEE